MKNVMVLALSCFATQSVELEMVTMGFSKHGEYLD
jgi:hypothetical protein